MKNSPSQRHTNKALALFLLSAILLFNGSATIIPSSIKSEASAATSAASTPMATATATRTPTLRLSPSATIIPPVGCHPRLWVRASDLPRLRSWAVANNPIYQNGLAVLAAQAKADMDAGHLPSGDSGSITWEQYPNEMYAMLFAFMSLIENDQAIRDDYAQRARTLLMYVMNEAAKGAADGQPFRDPAFSIYDRSRWWGEGFPLTVDWIYPYLTAQDKATIRQVFLRWADENMRADVTAYNHPEPAGILNDPVLISDTVRVRWSANNYYLAHMRQIGLMSLALDPANDPGGQLGAYLDSATGAWLYVVDHMLRTEAEGGFSPEGWEYGPESLGFMAHFMLALYTAGEADPTTRGSQVNWGGNPFWDAMIPALLHSLSPRTEASSSWLGDAYRPAWYGDGQHYWAPDFIGVFGPMGVFDDLRGNTSRLNAIRWIQTNTPPGGASHLLDRVRDAEVFRNAILYFLLFDPSAATPIDPHTGLGTTYYAPGIGRILARTDWGPDAAMLSYLIGWINIDHQLAEGNQFGFYRHGEWLTKGRVGWDGSQEPWGCNTGRSDYHNTLALENDPPDVPTDDFQYNCSRHGSQYLYVNDGDGELLAHSFGDGYVYVLGDATNLYNATELGSDDILHASRSLFWLQPDVIIIYDRATSATAGRFKRFWLNLPVQPIVNGRRATAVTASGQQLFITNLLPAKADMAAVAMEPFPDEVAEDEPMQYRLRVEAAGGPADVRFLHVLEGADAGASATAVSLVQSTSGTSFDGAVVGETAILFPVNLDDAFTGLTYHAPVTVSTHYITGLTPGGSYSVVTQTVGSAIEVTVSSGGNMQADSGGVLMIDCTMAADINHDALVTQPSGKRLDVWGSSQNNGGQRTATCVAWR
ncbi:MAG: hypothetical protein D6723_03630 [Acidobacteria bacterium]|nr:MAG: hypothetical protein D6723_03630 [Acidobacteriota bacterium]